MRRVRLLLLMMIVIVSGACNLSSNGRPPTPTEMPIATLPPFVIVTPTAAGASVSVSVSPTSLLSSSPVTSIPVTSVPPIGSQCQVYTTYSGTDPTNKLTMRSAPSTTSPQVVLVLTGVQVLLVPGTQEVSAEGYHWLNVFYVPSPDMRYLGWIARDSYIRNGVRQPSVATLVPTGTQAAC